MDQALALTGEERIHLLTTLPEDQWFERKSGRIKAKDLARSLVAFANAEGGVIVVGIHNKTLEGMTPEQINECRQASIDCTVPPVRVRYEEIEYDGKKLLIIRVDPGESMYATSSREVYLRIGDESRKLSLLEQQELMYDRGAAQYEATPVPLTVDDLDRDAMAHYAELIGSSSIEKMLAARDLMDRQGKLTVASELLFDERPQRDFPSAYVRIMVYGSDERGLGTEMTLEYDERIEGPLPQQIERAAEKIDSLIPAWQQLGENGRFAPVPRIPRNAWLEGLVNAVVHRSYSMMGDHIRFEIFPHRVEITSPGRFPGLVDPRNPLEIARYARNPRIARVCADMGITRELGEGIKRMFLEMKRRGLSNPTYRQSSSSVTLILSATDSIAPEILARLTKSARTVIDILRIEARPLGPGQVAELAGISRPTANQALQHLVKEGIVVWEGESAKDPRATWRLL